MAHSAHTPLPSAPTLDAPARPTAGPREARLLPHLSRLGRRRCRYHTHSSFSSRLTLVVLRLSSYVLSPAGARVATNGRDTRHVPLPCSSERRRTRALHASLRPCLLAVAPSHTHTHTHTHSEPLQLVHTSISLTPRTCSTGDGIASMPPVGVALRSLSCYIHSRAPPGRAYTTHCVTATSPLVLPPTRAPVVLDRSVTHVTLHSKITHSQNAVRPPPLVQHTLPSAAPASCPWG